MVADFPHISCTSCLHKSVACVLSRHPLHNDPTYLSFQFTESSGLKGGKARGILFGEGGKCSGIHLKFFLVIYLL